LHKPKESEVEVVGVEEKHDFGVLWCKTKLNNTEHVVGVEEKHDFGVLWCKTKLNNTEHVVGVEEKHDLVCCSVKPS
jgi:hypothetical protein